MEYLTDARTRFVESVMRTRVKLDEIKIAGIKTTELGVELRDFSSVVYALDLKVPPEAKVIVREFRLKMGSLLKTRTKTDLHDRGFFEQLQIPTPVCGLGPGLFAAAAGLISQEARRTDWPAIA